MANNSSQNTRAGIESTDKPPMGVTKTETVEESSKNNTDFLRDVSKNVKDALKLSKLGADPTYLKKLFTLEEKSSYETIESLEKITAEFEKYLQKAQTDEDKQLVEAEYQNRVEELRATKQQELVEAQQKEELERMSAFFNKTENILEENDSSIRGALLGPLNLITKPFEEFLGFDLGKSFRNLMFGDKSKKTPNENDVAKIGAAGAGYLFIANTIKKVFGKRDTTDEKASPLELFSKGGLKGGLGGVALKGLGIGSIVTSVLMMVTDGIIGAVKAESNNVSKFSGFLGAFLGGNMSGIKGALAGMGKWGLMGFGIGAKLAPVTGGISLLVGPLLGIVVGGVLGAIGGVRLAKGFDKFGAWFKDTIWAALKDLLNIDKFVSIWKGDSKLSTKIWDTIKLYLKTAMDFIPNLFKKLGKGFSNLKEKLPNIKEKVVELSKKIGLGFSNFFKAIWNGLKDIGNIIIGKLPQVLDFVWKGISSLVKLVPKIFKVIGTSILKAKDFIKKIITDKDFRKKITAPISNILNGIFSKVASIMDTVVGTIWSGVVDIKNIISESQIGQFIGGLFNKIGMAIGNVGLSIIESPFGQFIGKIFTTMKNAISSIGTKVIESPFGQWVGNIFDIVKTKIAGLGNKIVESPFGQWVSSLFSRMGEAVNNFFTENPIGKFLKKWIIDPISDFFTGISDTFHYIKDLGFTGNIKSIASGTWGENLDKYKLERELARRTQNVDDAIIKSDGSIIKTHPKDTLVALKDIPSSLRVEEQQRLQTTLDMMPTQNVNQLENKLERVIGVLQNILRKDPVSLTLPTMTRQDLDLIMTGGII